MHRLTLGQARDVCLQIRAWLEAGETERAARWLRRLRGERRMCSVSGCFADPLPDRPWCKDHRMVRIIDPPPSDRRKEILRLLALEPPLSDREVARRTGITPQRVGQIRKKEDIPNSRWRRRNYQNKERYSQARRRKT